MTLSVGTKVCGYEVLGLLGAGGMGEVYRARDATLKREVALKVLPSFFLRDPDRLRRFEQEARAAAALNHPNILAVFQMGTYDGGPYLVSELLEGSTLREQLRRGPMTVSKTVDFGVQIARGLAAAHEKGVVHRDLKPENLFVTKDGWIKILDFGLAKLTQSDGHSEHSTPTLEYGSEPGVVLGTVGYMSPEQVRGQKVDHRCDVFAFGAILYEMLTAKRAFQKPTSAETNSAILNEDPPSISQVAQGSPPALQRVVRRCLEKNVAQRFQSASDLAFALEALSDSGGYTTSGVAEAKPRVSWVWIAAVGVATALATALIAWWRTPPAVPMVEAVTQLTDDGEPKQGRVVTDGSRVYFNEGQTGSWRIAEVSVTGGRTALVDAQLANPQITGLAPEGSAILALVGGVTDPAYPMWSLPLPAGEPRRLGDAEVQDANFLSDGRIIFAKGPGLYVAERDGSNPRKLVELSSTVWDPNVSPDDKRIAFTSFSFGGDSNAIFEAALDGTGLRTILQGDQSFSVCCSKWTPDGNYLLFQRLENGRWDLWALSVRARLFRRSTKPVRLTNGPLSYTRPNPSRDGKQIFAIGTKRRGELVRYEMRSNQFLPFLSGISAIDPTFSRDGKWVAYISYPDHTLWRSGTDGTERLQLTYPPMEVEYPFISPDGKRVVFGNSRGEIHVISMDGGSPQRLVEKNAALAAWSPDGNFLVITANIEGKHVGEKNIYELHVFDSRTGKTSIVPSSQGIIGAWWTTQDTLVAAAENTTELLTFSFKTQKWTELASGAFVNWSPSLDSKYLYYTTGGAEPKALRLRFTDHEIETVTSLKDLRRVVDSLEQNTQISVAPDGSPVFTRDIGTQEIYALNVRWP